MLHVPKGLWFTCASDVANHRSVGELDLNRTLTPHAPSVEPASHIQKAQHGECSQRQWGRYAHCHGRGRVPRLGRGHHRRVSGMCVAPLPVFPQVPFTYAAGAHRAGRHCAVLVRSYGCQCGGELKRPPLAHPATQDAEEQAQTAAASSAGPHGARQHGSDIQDLGAVDSYVIIGEGGEGAQTSAQASAGTGVHGGTPSQAMGPGAHRSEHRQLPPRKKEPVLLIVPLRLGLENINPCYFDALKVRCAFWCRFVRVICASRHISLLASIQYASPARLDRQVCARFAGTR